MPRFNPPRKPDTCGDCGNQIRLADITMFVAGHAQCPQCYRTWEINQTDEQRQLRYANFLQHCTVRS
jgi:hypothetical protein